MPLVRDIFPRPFSISDEGLRVEDDPRKVHGSNLTPGSNIPNLKFPEPPVLVYEERYSFEFSRFSIVVLWCLLDLCWIFLE